MMAALSELTLLRPWWLLLLVLIPLWWLLARRIRQSDGGWRGVIPGPLLSQLQPQGHTDRSHSARWPVAALIILMSLALAGPSLRYTEQPLYQDRDNLVVVLDVSLSMLAEDLPPDRLTQAKRKIRDILRLREGAETALVAYAGDAHVVSPLTRDARVIESFLPALDPFMMPAYGGRADLGVARAVELLEQAGRGSGRILLVTDGIRDHRHEPLLERITGTDHGLDILATGTAEGAPIPLEDRGYLREDGETVIVRTDLAPLGRLATAVGGQAVRITTGDRDLEALGIARDRPQALHEGDQTTLRRADDGIWLLALIIPLLLLTRRHGHLSAVALAAMLGSWHPPAEASLWSGLWLTPDQRGERLLERDPEAAAELFQDRDWAATARYRAGDYQRAAELWGMLDTARARYNQGNALAFAGELEGAIAAYDEALNRDPDFRKAQENRQRLLELLQEQQQQESESEPEPESEGAPDSDPERAPDSQMEPESPESEGNDDRQDSPVTPETTEHDTVPEADEPQPGASWDDEDRHEQWLQRVPDNPASLLQRKFEHQHRQRQRSSDPTETDELW